MRDIYFDFDDVLLYSRKAFCDIYNEVYKEHEAFKLANHENIYRWDLRDECPLQENVQEIFGHNEFYKKAQPFEGVVEYLKKLSEKTNVYICSNGDMRNFINKAEWIQENLPFIAGVILISNSKSKNFHKGIVNMKGAIFVDDSISNLERSNAEIKICFSIKKYECNEGWNGLMASNWDELYKMLEHYVCND